MAAFGMLPASLAKLNPKYRTPVHAIVLIVVLSNLTLLFRLKMLV